MAASARPMSPSLRCGTTACDAAKARNITVWVVSFGTSLSADMQACASGDKAYQASNNAQLRTQFQAIAQQITRLRLSE